jgi:hypothetical protein
MASVAGRCPAWGVHPSGIVVWSPAVQPVRCPATWVRRPGSGGPAVCCPPVQRPALWCPAVRFPPPSVRTRPSPPTSGGGVGARAGAAGQPSPQEPVEVPVGCRVVERLGRRPSRPGGGRHCRGRALVSGGVGGGPGRVVCGRPRVPAERPGRPGRRAERPWLAAARGHGSSPRREVAAPAAWLPSRAGCATTVRGRRGACRPGGRAPEGPMGVPAG